MLGVCWGVLKVWRGVREVEGVAETVERGRKHGMLFFAMVLQRFCSWDWGEWSGWVAWEKSVVAGCAVFCNGFATLFDEWVKKSEM